MMTPGQTIQVSAYKSDGTCYRKWIGVVESVEEDEVVVVTPAGQLVEDVRGNWSADYAIRSYYWSDRHYSLLEVYAPGGELVEIYANIGSPIERLESELRFTDFELDVSRVLPNEARIVDEEEFRKASLTYGYSEDFREMCYAVASEAVGVVNNWAGKGSPEVSAD